MIEVMVRRWLPSDAERHLSSSATGLWIATSPIIAVVAARATGAGERFTATRWTGLAVGSPG